MTGTVTQLMGMKHTYCLITTSEGVEHFAHNLDFVIPGSMRVGAVVEFKVKPMKTGKRPAATEVVVVQQAA